MGENKLYSNSAGPPSELPPEPLLSGSTDESLPLGLDGVVLEEPLLVDDDAIGTFHYASVALHVADVDGIAHSLVLHRSE